MSLIYKILTQHEHTIAETSSIFNGSEIDLKDGYIHSCSSLEQVKGVLSRFFEGQNNLKLIQFDVEGLDVRFEISPRSGITYPHVYEPIPMNRLVKIEDI